MFVLSEEAAKAATCCVWRVVNSKAPCYLVGTVHSLKSGDFPLARGYKEALRDSKRFVFEMNPDRVNDFIKKFDAAQAYPKGDDIRRHVHPKTWQIITVNFSRAGMFGKSAHIGETYLPHGIQQLRPWAIAFHFYGIRGYNDFRLEGVNNYFANQGRRMHKQLAGLETDDEHVEILRGLNDIESELILLDAITHREKARGELYRSHAAWKRGDAATVWAIHQRFRNLDPGADVRLLDIRNVKWVPKIRAEFNSGTPTSIVVGVAHMLGPNGLIALLQRNHFKFEQL